MENWETKELGDLIEIYDSKRIPVNSRDRSKMQGEYPYYGASGIVDYVDDYLFNGRYLLIAEDGANLLSRKTPIAFFADGKFWVNNHAHIVRGKDGVAVDKFLQAYINTTDISGYVTGAAQPKLSQKNLKQIKVQIPEIGTQKRIASILSAFDDLIKNNTRRIEIMEEMARRIYREWFVHFRYLGHENDRLVPSDTELGEIPEGWEVKKLSDVAKVNPENISTDYEGEIEYINISGVNEGSIDETEIHDFEDAPSRAKRKVDHGDIIWSSVRPNLKSYALVLNPPTNQIASTGFGVIRPKKLPASFIYNFSTTEYFVQYLVNHTRGSAYPAVNVSDFKNAPILVPDEKLVERFDEITWSNYLQIDKLSRKNKKLKETRDLLLPKLISGRINLEKLNQEVKI